LEVAQTLERHKMGICIYCGKSAGIFRKQHKTCRALHDVATTRIPEFFIKSLERSIDPARFRELTDQLATTHFLSDAEYRALVIKGLDRMLDEAMRDKAVTMDELKSIYELVTVFGIEAADEDFKNVGIKCYYPTRI
jgi:hypothetical protein